MARYNWNPATSSDYPGTVLVATADDGAAIRLHLDAFDDEVEAAFVIETHPGRFVTTEESSCWPAVERYIPREVDAYEVFMDGNTFALMGICDLWKHSVLESAGRMS